MKLSMFLAAGFAAASSTAFAAPSILEKRQSSRGSTSNLFFDRHQYVHATFAANMRATAQSFRNEGDQLNARRADKIAETASPFFWYASLGSANNFETAVREAATFAQTKSKRVFVPLVIYNMPDRDCSSHASVGELQFSNGGFDKYKNMINHIASVIDRYPHMDFPIVVEPDSIGNMIANVGKNRCQPGLYDQYVSVYAHVIQRLQRHNVALYIDVAHNRWIGRPDNIGRTVDMIQQILNRAGGTTKIRGYSTNVSNFQPFKHPGPITTTNPNYDEYRYTNALASALQARNLPAKFIVDTGRSGRPEALRDGVWCNLKNAGLGPLPTPRPDTPPGGAIGKIDAFVWVKPPGNSDGSSIAGGSGFDGSCQGQHSYTPSPAAGVFFLDYAKMLIRNANPPVQA